MTSLEELKQRAKQGDRGAVQELRERGFFRDKRALQTGYEISSAQRRIWVLEQMDSAAAAYNMPAALLLEGHVNTTTLRDALSGLVDRHESLRTRFVTVDGRPRQFVAEQADVPWQEVDLRREADPQREAQWHARQHANAVFDLTRGPLLSARLLRLADNRWVLLFNVHHIVCDEWSLQVMARELMALYDAAVHGRDAGLRPLHIQYKDYAAWQNQQLAAPECRIHRDYWVNKLGGELSSLGLPADFPRPANKTFAGGTLSLPLPAELSDGLQRLGWRHGSSLFMTLTALVKVLLFRYTAAEDIVVGTPYAGRDQAELQDQIGFFVNTLVLRDRLQGTDGFSDVLEQVKTTVLEAFEHQIYPFDRLLEDLQVPRDLSRTPLFGVMLVLQHGGRAGLQLGDVRAAPFDSGYQVAKFDLTFEFAETPAGIQLGLNYNTDLFRERTVQRMLTHFAQLAASAVAHPDTGIGELGLLTPDEERKLIFEFNDTAADYPREQTIADLFEGQAKQTPDAVALEFGRSVWTYRQLDRFADSIARHLQQRADVGEQTPVAIYARRSAEMVAGLLGILKAGGYYVPLDTDCPPQRLAFMLEDCQARVLLTQRDIAGNLPETSCRVIWLDEEITREDDSCAILRAESHQQGDRLAYVIYTSGSTGQPKGVAVPHRAVVRLVRNTNYIELEPDDVIAQASNTSFDAATFEIWGALLNGAKLVGVEREVTLSPPEFARFLREHRITTLFLTTALFNQMARDVPNGFATLRHVLFGGELVDPHWVRTILRQGPPQRLLHVYGPTENTTFSTWYLVREVPPEATTVPIGAAISNTQLYVLDQRLRPVPFGLPGELYVGGEGLARGYLNRPDLTNQFFIPSPFQESRRLYNTGDTVRWLPGGDLEFIGRRDQQVKIRGFRIELGEIEAWLSRHPRVRDAVVLVREDQPGHRELVAYIVLQDSAARTRQSSTQGQQVSVSALPPAVVSARDQLLPESQLRAEMSQDLPAYMVPARFVFLDKLPLNANGKLDRKALPDPGGAATELEDAVPPQTPRELQLAAVWQQVLGREFVGANSNFFSLGGDSLKAIRVVNRLAGEMGVPIGIKDVFRFPTIGELARWIEQYQPGHFGGGETRDDASEFDERPSPPPAHPEERRLPAFAPLVRQRGQTPTPLSRAQRRLWSLYQMAPDSPAYNISETVRMTGPLDVGALEASLHEIVRRHEALRSCFPERNGGPAVLVRGELALAIPADDLTRLPEHKQHEEIQRRCSAEALRPFNLKSGPVFRVRLLRLAKDDHVVTLTMHHIVSDGWSMGVFLGELNQLYRSFAAGRPSPLPELTLQYSDFARWQEEWFEREAAAEQREWWIRQLADLTTLALPITRPRPPMPSFRGAVHVCQFPSSLANDLKTLGGQQNATLYATLLAAFAVLLHRYSDQDDIVVGSPVANRNRREIEPLIGFFVNSLVMRCDVSGQPSFRTVLRRVRDFTMEGIARQDFPFDELVKEIAPQRDAVSNPVFQVMFSFENSPAGALELPDLALTPISVETRISKFDLLINISESLDGLVAAFEYSTDLYDADAIARMADNYRTLAESIVRDPDRSVATLPILGEGERRQILVEWNQTDSAFPRDKCVHELFEEQARRQPGKVAVEFSDQRLSYGELNARANELAHYLRGLGVKPETLVALFVERSVEMVVALLGILKAGGAYVPLDPDDPAERLTWLLGEIEPALVLTQEHLAQRLAATDANVFRLDSDWSAVAGELRENPRVAVAPETLAYLLFTSGSTGTPKGVSVSHRSVVRLVKETDYAHLGAEEVHLQLAPLQFDASTFEIWGPLLNGGLLVVAPPHTPSLDEIGDYIRRYRVTTLWLTAGLFHVMVDERLDDLKPLRQLLVGGDVLSVQHVARALSELQGCQLINGYGPTENTTFTCCHRIEAADRLRPSIPIGRPIANTRVYILDRYLQATPIGVPGELCITGEGLARGYHNRPDLTNEQFIDNPIAGEPDSRLYKTGDLCRWLPERIIEFLGRRDQQVKIRGFRVELGEIESALVSHAAIHEAVVTSRKESTGKQYLVAYVTPASTTAPVLEDLRSYLESNLPAYMVPAYFVVLDKLPLNANGKVDRRDLPAPPELSPEPDRALEPPRNELEQAMVDAWRSVLGGRKLGVNDNYFHLGGDSITAIQLVSHLRQAGWELSVRDLFEHPTVRSLAPILQRREPRGEPSQEAVKGPVPLTPIQRWFFDEHAGGLHHFNQAVLLRSAERIDAAAIQHVLQRLWEHHDALRMTYSFRGADVSQNVAGIGGSPGFALVDLQNEQDESASLQVHADRVQGSFDLQHGPLLKAVLFRLQQSDRLLLVIHHLAVDGVSWRILLEDLQRGYGQWLQGESVKFYPKTDSFQHWAQQLQRLADSQSVLADLDFWSSVLDQDAPAFPPDTVAEGPNLYGDSETVHTSLSPEETTFLLTETHQAYDTEVNDLLLTALGRALSDRHESRHVLIALEGHGRERLDVELDLSRTVGWFTCWYPLLLPMGEGSLGEQIQAVRQALRGVPQRGLSFGILRYLTPPPLASGVHRACRPQLSFNYLGQFEGGDDFGLSFAPESSGRAISPRLVRVHDLDVIGIVTDGRLSLSITYHPHRHGRESVQLLLDAFRAQLRLVAEHCRNIGPRQTASREYTFSQLPADDFDRILQSLE